MRPFRQLLCLHWFDVLPSEQYVSYVGPIVCTEQREFLVMVEPRICSKCGLRETRRVGEPVFLGWQ